MLVNKLVYEKIIFTTEVIQNLDLAPDKFMTQLVRGIMVLIKRRILKLFLQRLEEQIVLQAANEQSKVSKD